MRENELAILEQYDIDVKNTKKVRDAVLCDTDKGLFIVKEMKFSEKRLSVLEYLGKHLQEQGQENIDWILRTKADELFCVSEEGTKYFLKHWFIGRECDVQREKDILEGVKNLADIHRALRGPMFDEDKEQISITSGEDLRQEFFRHNREMKKVRSFMRDKVGKGNFEFAFLKNFDAMYAWADCALERLKSSNYEELMQKSLKEYRMIHGDYNYHNILITSNGMATTNFEHVQKNLQVTDFYYFLRKAMEKHHWNVELGDKMIESYQKRMPFEKGELNYIATCLAYPEKFWKAANSYHRSRKVWIPAKNLEKLELVIRQTEEKKAFLKTIFSFHLL